jgi:hypothetical protein
MRFMLMFKSDQPPEPGVSPCRQQLPEMAKLMDELKRTGVVVATEGLMPSDTGARVRLSDGKLTVRDGPFAEAKELVAGFAVVSVKSKAEAVELAKRCLTIAGGGESDVLEVFDPATAAAGH